jgi:hypothetical protein
MSELQMRVSDDDRDRIAQELQQAYTEGRLNRGELDDRLGLALTAKTYADLAGLVSDLPDGLRPPDEVVVLESNHGQVKRSGDWAVPRRLRVVTGYGSVRLDFSEAVVPHPVVDVDLDMKYGSATIVLPVGGSANVDRFRSEWGTVRTTGVPSRPQPGGLHVVVSGSAGYGGLTVRHPRRRRWFGD